MKFLATRIDDECREIFDCPSLVDAMTYCRQNDMELVVNREMSPDELDELGVRTVH